MQVSAENMGSPQDSCSAASVKSALTSTSEQKQGTGYEAGGILSGEQPVALEEVA